MNLFTVSGYLKTEEAMVMTLITIKITIGQALPIIFQLPNGNSHEGCLGNFTNYGGILMSIMREMIVKEVQSYINYTNGSQLVAQLEFCSSSVHRSRPNVEK